MPGFISDSPLARDLVRIGDDAIAREDDAALRDYFTDGYVFHGPGAELGFDELRAYFASLRAAFGDLRLVREQIIVDGNFLAARTTFSGDFTGTFTYSPIGPVEPTGQHLEWEVIGTFRYDDDGRLAEEWVQTDYRGLLTKLGVTTTETPTTAARTAGDLSQATSPCPRSSPWSPRLNESRATNRWAVGPRMPAS
jgi:predicted ester cyclase